ncbi:MAG: hypothetical protein KA502_01795 [Candidatus Methanomethylophilaceae archaeon]|nr:hypothetical protein [Candidatus Methanomethylophilaceae archaeon]
MNSRQILAAVIFASLLSLAIAAFPDADTSDAAGSPFKFYEVSPENNGFTLKNCSESPSNLKGLAVTDGEGTLTFTESLPVGAGSAVTVVKSKDGNWFSSERDGIAIGERGIVMTKTFTLAKTGDDLSLMDSKTVLDAVCYGNFSKDLAGWSGEAVKIRSGGFIVRIASEDTDTGADWLSTKRGYMNLPFEPDKPYDCVVYPFTFPECDGIPIYDAISGAGHSVNISIYQLNSPNMIALLCDLEKRGVEVRVLLEGAVLGGDRTEEYRLMKSLTDAGGEVRLINDSLAGNYERYSYVHNKYAVIDGDKTVITSENWTGANLSTAKCNRGWGAVIHGAGYAQYMTTVFEHDYLTTFDDVKTLADTYPDLKPYAKTLSYARPDSTYTVTGHNASVIPVLSPYTSYSAMKYFIDGASKRVYAEQMDLGATFSNLKDNSPVSWMNDAAKRGADCRFILDITIDPDKSNKNAVDAINGTTKVKAATIKGGEGFGLTHNKGVIADDRVWVGSINWTDNSFNNNRETAVIISSKEVTDFYLAIYMKDWKSNSTAVETEGCSISHTVTPFEGKKIVNLSVDCPGRSSYVWTIDGSEPVKTDINELVLNNLGPGKHTVSVTVEDFAKPVTGTFEIPADPEPPKEDGGITVALAAAALAVGGIIAAALKGKKGDSRHRRHRR